MQQALNNNQKGFLALSMILIMSAVVLASAASVSLLSVSEINSSNATFEGERTLLLVEGCANDALLKLNEDANYAGGTTDLPSGSCTVTISNAAGTYTLEVSNTTGKYTRNIEIQVTRTSQINVISWSEV